MAGETFGGSQPLPAATRRLPLCETRLEFLPEHKGDHPANEQYSRLRDIHAGPPGVWGETGGTAGGAAAARYSASLARHEASCGESRNFMTAVSSTRRRAALSDGPCTPFAAYLQPKCLLHIRQQRHGRERLGQVQVGACCQPGRDIGCLCL
jgi:hypothetical protein